MKMEVNMEVHHETKHLFNCSFEHHFKVLCAWLPVNKYTEVLASGLLGKINKYSTILAEFHPIYKLSASNPDY